MADMTVIILTKDEEMHIEQCIRSVLPIAKRIVVMDSYSTDRTLEIAKSLGADVYQHPFRHYGAQFQYALDNTNINTKWVFRLDADEEVSAESRIEIEELCKNNAETDINGIVFRMRIEFQGRELHHGFLNIQEKLCIFKLGKAYMEDRYWGEQLILTEGRSISMRTTSLHHPVRDMSFMINKFNWYTTRETKDYFERRSNSQPIKELDIPSRVRRVIKYNIYYRLPPAIRSRMMFHYYYYVKLGFLDGREGYYWNFFQTYFYRLLTDAKIDEVVRTRKKIDETGTWD